MFRCIPAFMRQLWYLLASYRFSIAVMIDFTKLLGGLSVPNRSWCKVYKAMYRKWMPTALKIFSKSNDDFDLMSSLPSSTTRLGVTQLHGLEVLFSSSSCPSSWRLLLFGLYWYQQVLDHTGILFQYSSHIVIKFAISSFLQLFHYFYGTSFCILIGY